MSRHRKGSRMQVSLESRTKQTSQIRSVIPLPRAFDCCYCYSWLTSKLFQWKCKRVTLSSFTRCYGMGQVAILPTDTERSALFFCKMRRRIIRYTQAISAHFASCDCVYFDTLTDPVCYMHDWLLSLKKRFRCIGATSTCTAFGRN